MDPQIVIAPVVGPLPAPFWFIQFFKVVGFTLHLIPMGLWFVGILFAMSARAFGCEHSKRFSARLMRQMPFLIALGINFGIVPLLFVQLAYYQFFYTATILTAWHWLVTIVILIPAYYGVYYYSFGDFSGGKIGWFRTLVGWSSAGLFMVIGLLMANGFSLMVNVEAWPELWHKWSVAGATLGLGNNFADSALWARWLIVFSLGILTTAAWIVVDTAWFFRDKDRQLVEAYRAWTRRCALMLSGVGALVFAAAALWYVFGTLSEATREYMFSGWRWALIVPTAIAPALTFWTCLRLGRSPKLGTTAALPVALAQITVLALNASSRQLIQNFQVGQYQDISQLPTATQWSPLLAFVGLFVFGLLVIGWMVVQVIKATSAKVA
jgi:hypothetical protein